MGDALRERRERLLAPETYTILLLCVVDAVVTLYLFHAGRIREGNPIMAFYLQRGMPLTLAAKLVFVVPPLFLLEWARRRRPKVVHLALRPVLVVYVGLLVSAFAFRGV